MISIASWIDLWQRIADAAPGELISATSEQLSYIVAQRQK